MINFAKALRMIALIPLWFMACAIGIMFGVTLISSLLMKIV